MQPDHDETTCNDDNCEACGVDHDTECTDDECNGECLELGDDDEPEDDAEEDAALTDDAPAPTEAAAPPLVRLSVIPGDAFSPPAGSVGVSVSRIRADGTTERCEAQDPKSKVWQHMHRAPISAEELCQLWGSGSYRLLYFGGDGRLTGRRPIVTIDDPEHPSKPARARVEAPAPLPQRGAAAAPVRRTRLAAPPPTAPQLPPLPAGADAASVLALLAWAKQEAQADFDRRLLLLERESAQVEARADARHRRDMEDVEARHRRHMENAAAMTKDLLATAVERAQASAPIGELQTRLKQLEEELNEREEPAKPSELESIAAAALPLILARLGQQQTTPKPGGGQ